MGKTYTDPLYIIQLIKLVQIELAASGLKSLTGKCLNPTRPTAAYTPPMVATGAGLFT